MNTNNFTIKSQEVLQKAQELALQHNHPQLEEEHIALSLFQTDESVLPFILKKLGRKPELLRQVLESEMNRFSRVEGGQLTASARVSTLIQKAQSYSKEMKDEYIAIEHLVLALFDSQNSFSKFLKDQGVTRTDLKKAVEELRKGNRVTSDSAEDTYQSLEKYAKNLNQLADSGKLDPVIGRDEEIRRILQILSRRTKNNPILVGEPGVGKTAIAEGLAHRIVQGDVPENLKDKSIYSLDMGALLAGAKFKGEFEERLKSVVKEVVKSDGQVVLFIDEIHTLVGAGGGQGAMDAANILKPALARGELRAIGATTLDEFQKYFENDKALERRFQKVLVDEPSKEDAISILRGIKDKYEAHHKVRIKDEAVISAVTLSERYIPSRFLPDKAIDLMDEAAAKLRLEINSKPEELDILDRRIMQLEIEVEALKRENDQDKLKVLNVELANLREERNEIFAKWEQEKSVIEDIQRTKQQIEEFRIESERAERNGDYGRVAELRYGKIKEAQSRLEELQVRLSDQQVQGALIQEEVNAEDIAEVVARWTGIPVQKMIMSEREKLLHLEDVLKQRVIGQERAIEVVSDAIRRSRAGLQDAHRPIGSFMFLGSTGVGKTELAKALAEFLFDDEGAITRIDMSEYQEKHSVSRLVGAPPGYVGYEEGGQLTEAVRRRPYSVVLLDEIEKAHPDTFNILLQVLDEGRLTDNKVRVADFRNTIIVMTSNMGSDFIGRSLENTSEYNALEVEEKILQMLRQTLRPEFLNRIDDIVIFNPLDRNQIEEIVRMHLRKLRKQLSLNNITLDATEEAVAYLAEKGYDPSYGARPVKRQIQREVLNRLSKEMLAGTIGADDVVLLDAFDGELVFRPHK